MADHDPLGRRATMMLAADAAVLSAVSVFAAPLSLIAAPLGALWLHRVRIDRYWVGSLALGLLASVASVAGLFWAAGAMGLLRPDGYAGGIALLAIGLTAVGAVFAIVDVDAARDLISGVRAHVALDTTRLVATAIMLAGGAAIAIAQFKAPESEIGAAAAFSVLSAVCVGAGTLLASVIQRRWRERGSASRGGVAQGATQGANPKENA